MAFFLRKRRKNTCKWKNYYIFACTFGGQDFHILIIVFKKTLIS